jgi:superfamily II DNA/RNA helicase
LIATDVASEGLNLQETARLVFHFDIPWNPSRLEQRNGRLDRHGQARDVTVFHFTSEDDADLKFIGKVVQKVHEIRDDLGSMGEVFDAAFERRFLDQEDTDSLIEGMEHDVKKMKGRAAIPHARQEVNGEAYAKDLGEFSRHIDLSPATLRDTLEVAMGAGCGYWHLLHTPSTRWAYRAPGAAGIVGFNSPTATALNGRKSSVWNMQFSKSIHSEILELLGSRG